MGSSIEVKRIERLEHLREVMVIQQDAVARNVPGKLNGKSAYFDMLYWGAQIS